MESYWDRITKNHAVSRRRLIGTAGGGLTAAAILAACGSSNKSSSSSGAASSSSSSSSSAASSSASSSSSAAAAPKGAYSPSDGTPVSGGRLAFTATSNASYNALADWSEGNYLAGSLVYDRPVTTRPDTRRYVLEAMESIEQPDPLKVVMKLRSGLVYSDTTPVSGRPVKASDYAETQKFIAALTNAYDKTFVTNYLDSTETPDDRTITVKLKKPLTYLFGMGFLGNGTGQPIIPAETLTPDMKTAKPIGSGPYLLDSAQVGVGAVYKKNPKFRDADKTYIAEREYKVVNDPALLEAGFRSGQIDWSSSTSTSLANSLQKDSPGKQLWFKVPGIADGAFRWNMTKPDNPWRQDVRVREAIWRLTNRQQLLELGQNNGGVIVDALMCAALPQYFPDAKDIQPYFQEDVAKANQLLKAANWDPNREVVLLISAASSDPFIVWQQQLQRGGIKTRIDNYTGLANFFQKIGDGNWDAFADSTPGSGDPYVQIRNQHSASWSSVYKGFALMDPDIDAMIEKSEQTTDVNENIKLVKQIQVEAMKKFTSSMTLYTLNTNWMLQPRVQNWELAVTTPNPHRDAWIKA